MMLDLSICNLQYEYLQNFISLTSQYTDEHIDNSIEIKPKTYKRKSKRDILILCDPLILLILLLKVKEAGKACKVLQKCRWDTWLWSTRKGHSWWDHGLVTRNDCRVQKREWTNQMNMRATLTFTMKGCFLNPTIPRGMRGHMHSGHWRGRIYCQRDCREEVLWRKMLLTFHMKDWCVFKWFETTFFKFGEERVIVVKHSNMLITHLISLL